mmetsp:Transcript_27096/g.43006  ORF Transcript_27096/g.43006 Transcript_27096/m.43006 type:complete len:94 (+) Transcript_27096:114-395(+)
MRIPTTIQSTEDIHKRRKKAQISGSSDTLAGAHDQEKEDRKHTLRFLGEAAPPIRYPRAIHDTTETSATQKMANLPPVENQISVRMSGMLDRP